MAKIAHSAIRRKKHRAEQVRDAQRRRRERLKSQNLGFLQIILPEQIRTGLEREADESQKTLQQMALILLARSLGLESGLELLLGRQKTTLSVAGSTQRVKITRRIPALQDGDSAVTPRAELPPSEEKNDVTRSGTYPIGPTSRDVIASSDTSDEPLPDLPGEEIASTLETDTQESGSSEVQKSDPIDDESYISNPESLADIDDASPPITPKPAISQPEDSSDKKSKKKPLTSRRKKDEDQMEFF